MTEVPQISSCLQLDVRGSDIHGLGSFAVSPLKKGTLFMAWECQYLNHSCDSNLGMEGDLTYKVRRDIETGEELTLDVALFVDRPDRVALWECNCGSPFCRGRVTGQDWKRLDLQQRYSGLFAPEITEKLFLTVF